MNPRVGTETASSENAGAAFRSSTVGPPRKLNRVLELLAIVSFFLPFATVADRSSSLAGSYTGIDLVRADFGPLLAGVPTLAMLLFVLSFRPRIMTVHRVGSVQAVKACLCALAGMTAVVLTEMTFLFWDVEWRSGLFVCLGSWTVLYLLSVIAAYHCVLEARRTSSSKPPPWGVLSVLAAIAISLVTILVSSPSDIGEMVSGLAAGAVVVFPVILLVLLAATRRRSPSHRADELQRPPEVRVEE